MGNNALFISQTVSAIFGNFTFILADLIGRKRTFTVVSGILILGCVLTLAKVDYSLVVAGMFLIYLGWFM